MIKKILNTDARDASTVHNADKANMAQLSQTNSGQTVPLGQRIQKTWEMVNTCTKVMLRENYRMEMLQQVCQIMVKKGGYQAAWIGTFTHDEQKRARRMWQIESEVSFPAISERMVAETATENHPVVIAIRTRQPVVIKAKDNQNHQFPWKSLKQLPVASTLVLPLLQNGQTVGVCCLLAAETNAFEADELKYLNDFADDLAYVLAKVQVAAYPEDKLTQLQEELRMQQHEQQTIFDAVPAMICFKDLSNRVIHCNQAFAAFYNLEKQEVEGKLANDFDPAHAEQHYQDDLKIINSGEPELGIIEHTQQTDGSFRWFQTHRIPYFDEKGKSAGVIIFSQEVTALKQAEESLKETLDELQKKNYELDKYFYKVSHDIRAPLCSVLGLINLMRLEKDVNANEVYIGLIEKSVKKLDSFIQTILNHSRTLNSSTHITVIDFNKIINNCLKEFSYLPQAANLKTTVKLHSNYKFYNDYDRIAIIFRHLISNAIKYMNTYAAENYLKFDINVSADKAYIVVEDNGIGIEKQYLNKIFDMFLKATDKSDGAGLGLYIVKQTVDKMGGNISVKSEIGKGTSFRIILANFQS